MAGSLYGGFAFPWVTAERLSASSDSVSFPSSISVLGMQAFVSQIEVIVIKTQVIIYLIV